jgi:hypothetical protein
MGSQLVQGAPIINGNYSLGMQNGDLEITFTSTGSIVWDTKTTGASTTFAEIVDGNLRVRTSDQQTLWASGTSGNPGACAVLQVNGILVIQRTNGVIIWSSSSVVPALSTWGSSLLCVVLCLVFLIRRRALSGAAPGFGK